MEHLSQYIIQSSISITANSQIYKAISRKDNMKVAVKILSADSINEVYIQTEILQKLQLVQGFPKLEQSFQCQGNNIIVMERLGISLKQFTYLRNFTINKNTLVIIGMQLIDRIKSLHSHGYIHCDIKPDNIVFGLKQNRKKIYLIDFGMSHNTYNRQTITNNNITFQGNMLYSSVKKMNGDKSCINDDIESIAYIIIEILTGTLPWKNIEYNCARDLFQKIKEIKRKQHLIFDYKIEKKQQWAVQFLKYIRTSINIDYNHLKTLVKKIEEIHF